MRALFHILDFLAEFAWLVWPAALLGDVIVSKRCAMGTAVHRSRWLLRATHSLTLAAVAMIFGVEFFWLRIVNIHYHGGWEVLVVGPLVLYVSIRLAQRLDMPPRQCEAAGIHSAVALWLPAISAAFLFLAGANSVARSIPFLSDREPTLIFLVPLLSLIAAGSLCRCSIRRAHVVLASSLAAASLLLTAVFFVAAGFKFFGFLPWGHANDDPWFYALTGLVCFTILSVTSILRRRTEPNQALNRTSESRAEARLPESG